MAQGRSALWHKDVRRFSLFFALSYFVQGVTDLTSGFANQPVQFLLKEQMGLSAAQTGFFFAVSIVSKLEILRWWLCAT